MAYTFEELKHKTVEELREIAKGVEHEAVKGYSQLNKEHLLPGLCTALGIEMHAHHEVTGINKAKMKTQIQALKKKRTEALAAKDHKKLKQIRLRIHACKRTIKKHTV